MLSHSQWGIQYKKKVMQLNASSVSFAAAHQHLLERLCDKIVVKQPRRTAGRRGTRSRLNNGGNVTCEKEQGPAIEGKETL